METAQILSCSQYEQSMNPRIVWVIVGVAVIIAVLFAGFLALPGQKDNVTPTTQPTPAGKSPQPTTPKGPPEKQEVPKASPK
jgi:hypothetical protein